MYSKLTEYFSKPALYTPSTGSFWDDEHISKGMLEAHLNPDWNAATRKHGFLEKSVEWIATIAPPPQFCKLLDLGCGPGLYAERFSEAGYCVTGIDFSKRSIEYAREKTARSNSNIEYLYQDYLSIDYTEQFDVVTLIYCDYPVLSAADRAILMGKIHRALKPGGKLIFDAFMPRMRNTEGQSWENCGDGGFYYAEPHIHFEAVYQYDDDDKTELEQHIVLTESHTYCYNIWNHYLDRETLITEAQNAGFSEFEFFGDIAGSDYSDTGETICGVITK